MQHILIRWNLRIDDDRLDGGGKVGNSKGGEFGSKKKKQEERNCAS